MKLREILPPDTELDPRDADIEIGGVTSDSRNVKPGDLFVAIAGNKTDGSRFRGGGRSPPAQLLLPRKNPA